MEVPGLADLALKGTYNVLLLGCGGVGKSTFINALANYLTFKDFDEAIQHEPKWLIPSVFHQPTVGGEVITVSIGNPQAEEQAEEQVEEQVESPQVYSFYHLDARINFIESPGFDDYRGMERDAKIVQEVINTVSQFEKIHLICVFNQASQTKVTNAYKYRLNQILEHFRNHNNPNNDSPNVALVFTNSICVDFMPEELEYLIHSLKRDVNGPISRDNCFTVDSRGFRYQCIKHQHPQLLEDNHYHFLPEMYEYTWNISSKKIKNMLRKM